MVKEDTSYLSKKPISPRERLIFALDVPSVDDARGFVNRFGDLIQFYKLGLELFMADGYFSFIKWLVDRNKKVMIDLKFFDIPETVASAVRQLKKHQATFVTVHGNEGILKAAVKEKNGLKILAVTVLTSLDEADLKDLGFKCSVEELVLSRARRAIDAGCDGVISSGLEAPRLRESLGNNFLIIAPGIRPVKNREDDQRRVVDIEEAFRNGADYIVVGRPIRNAPDPCAEAEKIQERIASLFGSSK